MVQDRQLNQTEVATVAHLYSMGHRTHVIAHVMGLSELSLLSQLSHALPFTHNS